MMVAIRPASPKLWIRSELENYKAMKDKAAVAWVRTQAGPTINIALRKASQFAFTRKQTVSRRRR